MANPLTRANGMRQATLAALGDAPGFLVICGVGTSAGSSGCGPAANQLTRRAAFVLLSLGPNAAQNARAGQRTSPATSMATACSSRTRSRPCPATSSTTILTWVPVNVLASRMIAAGRLP